MPPFAFVLVGYLLGSIPFGLLLTRAAGLGDIRRIGSGNIGATNVLRTGNKGLAAATLLLDGGKGAVAVLLAAWFGGHDGGAVGRRRRGAGPRLPGLARLQGRQGRRDRPRRAARRRLAGRDLCLRDLAGGGRRSLACPRWRRWSRSPPRRCSPPFWPMPAVVKLALVILCWSSLATTRTSAACWRAPSRASVRKPEPDTSAPEDALDRLRLARSEGVGPVSYRRLLSPLRLGRGGAGGTARACPGRRPRRAASDPVTRRGRARMACASAAWAAA